MTAKRGRKSAASESVTSLPGMSSARIQPPEHMPLDDQMRALWDEIVRSLPADYFRPGDAPLLAAYCMATVFYMRAAEEIQEGPTLMDDKGRRYANPAGQLLNTQAAAMAQLAVKLRLCPSARYSTRGASSKTDNAGAANKPWSKSA